MSEALIQQRFEADAALLQLLDFVALLVSHHQSIGIRESPSSGGKGR
jgi:hypothetical protein